MTETRARSWRAVQQEVLRRIHDRIWRPGEMIPNEADLAAEFGCARATVNRALRELSEAGTLVRRRKAGTHVALNPVRKAIFTIPVIRLEIEAMGAAYGYRLLEARHEPAPTRLRKDLAPSTNAILRARALHLADERPYVYEDRWINTDVVPEILSVDLTRESANEWLVNNAPLSRGDFTFSAANATVEEAEILDIRPGTALFVVERMTWDGPVLITSVRLAFAPGYQMRTAI